MDFEQVYVKHGMYPSLFCIHTEMTPLTALQPLWTDPFQQTIEQKLPYPRSKPCQIRTHGPTITHSSSEELGRRQIRPINPWLHPCLRTLRLPLPA